MPLYLPFEFFKYVASKIFACSNFKLSSSDSIKLFVKKIVTSETPYKHNGQTAPAFKIKDSRNFETEKIRLIDYINKTQQLGANSFDNKDSHSFGKLSTNEWNNMFYKHLDHHLHQFGV